MGQNFNHLLKFLLSLQDYAQWNLQCIIEIPPYYLMQEVEVMSKCTCCKTELKFLKARQKLDLPLLISDSFHGKTHEECVSSGFCVTLRRMACIL